MPFPRLQLFELEDLTWFPHTIRGLATDYLHFMETRFDLQGPVVPLLRVMLKNSKTSCEVDLCSGAGGPVLAVYEALAADEIHVQFTLIDKFPNIIAFQRLSSKYPSGIRYVTGPVEATNVPKNLVGLRTMFNAFHHFEPRSARLVLENAVQCGNRSVYSNSGTQLTHDGPVPLHTDFCCIGDAIHTAIPMESLAQDLCHSLDPAYMLVGWSGVCMARVYSRRDAGNDARFRRLRLDGRSGRTSRQSRTRYLCSGRPAFFAHFVCGLLRYWRCRRQNRIAYKRTSAQSLALQDQHKGLKRTPDVT